MTQLSHEHVRQAVERLRNACPACGGNGVVSAESSVAYMPRLRAQTDLGGTVIVRDLLLDLSPCPECAL